MIIRVNYSSRPGRTDGEGSVGTTCRDRRRDGHGVVDGGWMAVDGETAWSVAVFEMAILVVQFRAVKVKLASVRNELRQARHSLITKSIGA